MARSKKTSDYIKVQRSREIRLWVTEILAVAGGTAMYLESHPEAKQKLADIGGNIKNKIRSIRFNRKEKTA